MTKLSMLLAVVGIFLLSSCETTREITLNENGGGTFVTTTDMSGMIAIAKMNDKDNKMAEEKGLDTTVMLDKLVDSIPDLSAKDKDLLRTGKLDVQIDMANDKFLTRLHFDFANSEQLTQLAKLSQKVTQEAMKKQMGDANTSMPEEGMPETDIEDYFTTTYSKGIIEKKLNAEKYAGVSNDQGMEALKQIAGQGMAMNTTYVFNLPRPAKKAEGKGVKLSEDKKKVTINTSTEDFFDDPSKFEFRIEY